MDNILFGFLDRIFPRRHVGLPSGKTSCPPLLDATNLVRETCLHWTDDEVTLLVMEPRTVNASRVVKPLAFFIPPNMRPWVLRASCQRLMPFGRALFVADGRTFLMVARH